jgi:hemerythrin
MALITWNEDLMLGIHEIDMQHKRIVDMINKLHDSAGLSADDNVVNEILTEMLDYTQTHFTTEEKYFTEFNYAETDSHKESHDSFIEKITDFQQDFKDGKEALSSEMMQFLTQWLIGHIKGSDKQYVELFLERGVK